MSCWHLWRMFTKPFPGSGTLHFRWEALWFSLFIKPAPCHIEMSRWKPRRCVRWRCRLHHRESPGETSHKGDTHAHSYTHSASPVVTHPRWLIGVPQTCAVTTLQLSYLQKNQFGVNWVDFSISLCVSFIKRFFVMGKPCLTFSTSTFSYFFYSVAESWIQKNDHRKPHTC